MRYYEMMFIFKFILVEEEIKFKIEFYKEVIIKYYGVIEISLDMGMCNLVYEIKKYKRGYYYVVYFKVELLMILEFEWLYCINEDVLCFIVIKYESKKEVEVWYVLVDRVNKKLLYVKEKYEKIEYMYFYYIEEVESVRFYSE